MKTEGFRNAADSLMEAAYDTTFTMGTEQVIAFMNDNADVADMINRIKTDERFAYTFFYGRNRIPNQSIAPIRERLISMLRKTYHLDIEPYVISTVIYEHLWSDGSWKSLDNYSYRSSFFYWLSTVASHAVMKFLNDNGYIKTVPDRTVGNTRLTLKNKSADYCKMVIDDMVHIPQAHDFLTAMYVDGFSKKEMQKMFNLNDSNYNLVWKASETVLKNALLNTEHNYKDTLVDKTARKTLVSSDFLTLIGQTNPSDDTASPLRDILGISPAAADFEDTVLNFLYSFSEKLFTNKTDRTIWLERYLKDTPPVQLADQLGCTRGYIDCRYNRTKIKFKTAIQKWYNDMVYGYVK